MAASYPAFLKIRDPQVVAGTEIAPRRAVVGFASRRTAERPRRRGVPPQTTGEERGREWCGTGGIRWRCGRAYRLARAEGRQVSGGDSAPGLGRSVGEQGRRGGIGDGYERVAATATVLGRRPVKGVDETVWGGDSTAPTVPITSVSPLASETLGRQIDRGRPPCSGRSSTASGSAVPADRPQLLSSRIAVSWGEGVGDSG